METEKLVSIQKRPGRESGVLELERGADPVVAAQLLGLVTAAEIDAAEVEFLVGEHRVEGILGLDQPIEGEGFGKRL